MTKYITINFIFLVFSFASCGQINNSINKTKNIDTTNQFDQNLIDTLNYDSSKIVILSSDKIYHIIKGSKYLKLVDTNLIKIEELFFKSINKFNIGKDSSRKFSAYVKIDNYKIQYIPFLNSKGEKSVYINCFCDNKHSLHFTGWKTQLIEVFDGGICFFHMTINLTKNECGDIHINGYG